jgi:hypothetical protein
MFGVSINNNEVVNGKINVDYDPHYASLSSLDNIINGEGEDSDLSGDISSSNLSGDISSGNLSGSNAAITEYKNNDTDLMTNALAKYFSAGSISAHNVYRYSRPPNDLWRILSRGWFLIFVSMTGCPFCHTFSTMFEQLSNDPGMSEFKFLEIDRKSPAISVLEEIINKRATDDYGICSTENSERKLCVTKKRSVYTFQGKTFPRILFFGYTNFIKEYEESVNGERSISNLKKFVS